MPEFSTDDELRAVVFAEAQRLRARYSDRIPCDELGKGVQLHGKRVPIWNFQKGIFKPAVLGRDGAALNIQTSAESPYDDVHDPDAGHFIYKYQGGVANHADNRALRNAMLWQRPLLYLVAVDPGFYEAVFPTYVIGDDPAHLQFALAADQLNALASDQSSALALARREYVTRAVMQRMHQKHFRRVVLRAYHDRCAICRLGHFELLDAAHILRDRHPKGEPLVNNGMGLCKIHHCAFDANILGIDPLARVHIRQDILNEVDGPMLKHGLQDVHGWKLILPSNVGDRPKLEFLEERFSEFLAA